MCAFVAFFINVGLGMLNFVVLARKWMNTHAACRAMQFFVCQTETDFLFWTHDSNCILVETKWSAHSLVVSSHSNETDCDYSQVLHSSGCFESFLLKWNNSHDCNKQRTIYLLRQCFFSSENGKVEKSCPCTAVCAGYWSIFMHKTYPRCFFCSLSSKFDQRLNVWRTFAKNILLSSTHSEKVWFAAWFAKESQVVARLVNTLPKCVVVVNKRCKNSRCTYSSMCI